MHVFSRIPGLRQRAGGRASRQRWRTALLYRSIPDDSRSVCSNLLSSSTSPSVSQELDAAIVPRCDGRSLVARSARDRERE